MVAVADSSIGQMVVFQTAIGSRGNGRGVANGMSAITVDHVASTLR